MGLKSEILRRVLNVAALAAAVLLVVVIRVVTSARAELQEADLLLAEGDVDASIVHYRRAARWYAPLSPYHVEALVRLAKIAQQAEEQGNAERALSAHRAIRSAILAARSFYTPEEQRLKRANARIADLMASLPPPPIDAGKSRAQLRKEHLALLASRPGPDIAWTWVVLLGFLAWVGGGFAFAARAIDEQNRLVWTEIRKWGTVIVLGIGLFVLGMAFA